MAKLKNYLVLLGTIIKKDIQVDGIWVLSKKKLWQHGIRKLILKVNQLLQHIIGREFHTDRI